LISLLAVIKSNPSGKRIKDGNSWELTVGNNITLINPDKVPEEYKDLFEKLKGDLRIVK
jgi:hypothetical protein